MTKETARSRRPAKRGTMIRSTTKSHDLWMSRARNDDMNHRRFIFLKIMGLNCYWWAFN